MQLQDVLIRDETPTDFDAISEVTVEAFKALHFPELNEHYIIEALRDQGILSLSLVAEFNGRVIGHIAFSPAILSDGTTDWYTLGPVSVWPDYQRQGIGKALINEGLSRLKATGAKGCYLVGHPEYYVKFGFVHVPGLSMDDVPPEVLFGLSFNGQYPQGKIILHPAFRATGHPGSAEA